jgi:hypothetical protein
LVEDSVDLARETGVDEEYTINGQAKNIVQIVERYLKTLPRWKDLVTDPQKDYEPKLERFLGTHQTVPESFIAKVIEIIKGSEEVSKFVDSLSGAGFTYSEGFDVDIFEEDGEGKIRVKFTKTSEDGENIYSFNEVIDRDILDQIINL